MKRAPRISLCMIVKDEEATLERCLRSASSYVDEIVIADTGSSDRSVEIARSFGAHVVSEPWADDFAKARNRTIAESTGDFMLFLDADETLTPEAGVEIRSLAADRSVLGVYFPLRDFGDDRVTVTQMFRAVRRMPNVRWEYRIHEQILPSVLPHLRAGRFRLAWAKNELHHDGYKAEVLEKKGKNQRNLRLYEAQVLESPDDPYLLYKFGDFLRRFPGEEVRSEGLLNRALEAVRKIDARTRKELTYGGELCALIGLAEMSRGATATALAILEFGRKECRNSANLDYVLGLAQLSGGVPELAEDSFRRCHAAHGKPDVVPAQPQITGISARLGLIRALHRQRRDREAADEAWELLTSHPENLECLNNWIDSELTTHDYSRAIQRLIQRVQAYPLCGATWLHGGQILFRLRLLAKAAPWLLRAAELLDPESAAVAWRVAGEAFLGLGHNGRAREAFQSNGADVRCQAGLHVLDCIEGNQKGLASTQDTFILAEAGRILENLRSLGCTDLVARYDAAQSAGIAAFPPLKLVDQGLGRGRSDLEEQQSVAEVLPSHELLR